MVGEDAAGRHAGHLDLVVGAVAVAVLSACMVAWLIRRFRTAGILDQVGARSSHTQPTPRGGGLGFVVAATLAWMTAAWVLPGGCSPALLGVASAGVVVAGVGFLDDLRGVPAAIRLLVHLAAAAAGLWAVAGPVPPAEGWPVAAVAVVATAWFVNAFNFMDGTDGFAATHGVAVTGMLVAMLWGGGPALPLGVAAAVLGFLPFNWPRARIFMGDVGSGWLGLAVAMSLVWAWRNSPEAAAAALAWLSPFIMDPTVCLARRAARGERVWQAHRSHGFQNLARLLGSHARLLAAWWSVSLVVYLPLWWLTWRGGWWPWLPLALACGAVQALALRSGVPGVAEVERPPESQSRH